MSKQQGHTLNKSEGNNNSLFNPFPGLRPFSTEESHLFFGREGQSEEVLKNLSENRFVAVMGASGSGKSSLILCGLIPALHGRLISDSGKGWQVVHIHPGIDPIKNLTEGLARVNKNPGSEESQISAIIDKSPMGLVEAVKMLRKKSADNFFILIDQFEELFRYRKSSDDQSAIKGSESFVNLLVEAVRQSEEPIYIVLTMRSDFIGECAHFQELTELINQSNYLVPLMTRDTFKEAITGPVAVGGANIEPSLIEKLLDDAGDNPDQLPILQHAMMRTWDYWSQLGDMEKAISISDYEAIGTMEKALSDHANEVFDELSQEGKRICESIFKRLSEKGADNRGIRHPTSVESISAIARTEIEKIIEIIENFRAAGRSFLVPAAPARLDRSSIIDLSHESLMRVWDRLIVWVDEEAMAVNMYSRLADASEMYQEGKTGLWKPPDLQLTLNWKKKQQPTLIWAERYNPAFERAMVYLDTSEKEFIAEEENKVKLQRRALRRTRITALVLGAAAILSIGFMLFALDQKVEADKQRVVAEDQTVEAKTQRAIAVENENIANFEKVRAEENAEEARIQKVAADSAKVVAIKNEEEATSQRNLAIRNENRAVVNENRANENAEEAKTQQKFAEVARDETYNLRLLSIAQSMSVKSLQVDQDDDLKALLAYQAFQFHEKYGGNKHNRDIYSGLYDASKALLGEDFYSYKGHEGSINSVASDPVKNQFYTAGSDGKLFRWDLSGTSREPKLIAENQVINRVVRASQDGKWLACGTEGAGIQLWDLTKSLSNPSILMTPEGRVRDLAFLPGVNKLISSGIDSTMVLWDLTFEKPEEVYSSGSVIQTLDISKTGDLTAAGTQNGEILLFDKNNWGNPMVLFAEKGNSVHSIAINHSGTLVATGDRLGNVKIWDIESRQIITNLRGHTARVNDLCFSPQDEFLASAGMDGKVQVWNSSDWNIQSIVVDDTENFAFSVAFDIQGDFLIAGSMGEKSLMIRPTHADEFVSQICSNLDRNLTGKEWNIYVGEDINYEQTCSNLTSDVDLLK